MTYKHIIWDYNGTLLDDVQLCVDCMNILLKKYDIQELTLEKYKEIFDFPVKTYYECCGFDFSKFDFNVVGVEFIDYYHFHENELKLKPKSAEVIKFFHQQNVKQSVLSAREQNKLNEELKRFNIYQYFDYVSGLDNHLAAGKTENGHKLIEKINLPKSEIVLIGDTTHDYEVASELEIDCILIADGHQNKSKLAKSTNRILNKLDDLFEI